MNFNKTLLQLYDATSQNEVRLFSPVWCSNEKTQEHEIDDHYLKMLPGMYITRRSSLKTCECLRSLLVTPFYLRSAKTNRKLYNGCSRDKAEIFV